MSSRYHSSDSRSSHRDRDRERRRSPSPRRRHGSPGPSRRDRRDTSSPRRDREPGSLPSSFDREPRESKDDQRDVLERMEKGCDSSPMKALLRCIHERLKLKVWTRNYKEVRGICTGYITYFDKHWNIVMKDVHEIYLRPKKGKSPYLGSVDNPDAVPEAKPRVLQPKKTPEAGDAEKKDEEVEEMKVEEPTNPEVEESAAPEVVEESAKEGEEKKKKKRRKRKKTKMEKRNAAHLFLRGDNIVMIAICEDDDEEEEEDVGKVGEKEGGGAPEDEEMKNGEKPDE